jgi:protein subunit release factor A
VSFVLSLVWECVVELMFDKLKGVEERFVELEKLLSDPVIVTNREVYQKYSRELFSESTGLF